ncbi:MAG TPA: PilZ domain-containing protein [Cellvibrionaceae bacterium]|nr:PilZ domain-containing protein [Cellvibrionaceae bacterium]HMW49045.1 PilZ domain-containing protein [Cellvibrionaceae bacterium]HMW71548.1 PilZ domain-containing protein [Cellvibrionaceae bacterium]HNG58757.1 PilZ domain-containing protein [Cellvibrionaceae bacterium]
MELSTRNYQEKRSFIRMKLDCPAKILLESEELTGVCSNLSGGGMLLVLDAPINLGTECVVSISSHFGHGPMLRAKTKVIRAMSCDGKCHAGLSIVELLDNQ